MFDDETFDICRYEVGKIVNNNRDTIIVTNDLETANNYYEAAIKKLSPPNDISDNIRFNYNKLIYIKSITLFTIMLIWSIEIILRNLKH